MVMFSLHKVVGVDMVSLIRCGVLRTEMMLNVKTASCVFVISLLSLAPCSDGMAQGFQCDCKVTAITQLDDSFPGRYRRSFDRYVQVISPDGKPINIFAQKEISDRQLLHVRDVTLHFLTNVPGSRFGFDKGKVANRMASNHAMLMILKGSDGEFREPRIPAQPLFATEVVVEGSPAYITNDYEGHRDATLEEVLHCVHDNGIGVDVPHAPKGVLGEYQKEIRRATTHAMDHGLWPTPTAKDEVADWIEELRDEGSLTQEYLASVVDSYYGLWGPFEESGGMWGIYAAKARSDIKQVDPQGYRLMQMFFPEVLTYSAKIDPNFRGTFFLKFNPQEPYTHKSRYLVKAALGGSQNSNLVGNAKDNRLAGNQGNNRIDGMEGEDTVVYPGPKTRYRVTELPDGTIEVVGDGVDRLVNIEHLEFDGEKKKALQIAPHVPHNLPSNW